MPNNLKLNDVLEEIFSVMENLTGVDIDEITDQLVESLIETGEKGNRIIVYGAGRSGYIGRSLVMRLVQCGFKAHFTGEASTPPMDHGDMLLVISGSGKTSSVEMIIKSASANSKNIYIITSQPIPNDHFKMVIAIKGKNKMDNESSRLPLGSSFEINAFIYLECLIAKIIDQYPPAEREIKDVSDRYMEGKMIVF